MGLALVPFDDLIDEIGKRRENYVLAISRVDTGNELVIDTFWSGKNWVKESGMAAILSSDIITDFQKENKGKDG